MSATRQSESVFTLACQHRPPCPGCPQFGAFGLALETEARLRAWCSEIDAPLLGIGAGPAAGYRVRARLSVRARRGVPEVGIFRERSHELVDIPECVVQHALVNHAAQELKAAMLETGTPAYDEHRHQGFVRALQVVVERASQTAQVVIVENTDDAAQGEALSHAFARRMGSSLHSLFSSLHPGRNNVVLGKDFVHRSGPPAVREELAGASVFFPPGAFGQANLDLFDTVLSDLHAELTDDQRIVELYAGVGAIGLGRVSKSLAYTFNEVSPDSIVGLEMGIASLPTEIRSRVRVLPGPAGTAATVFGDADVVIVDPPRKGLDIEVVEGLVATSCAAKTLLYLSCGFASLARDEQALRTAYRPVSVRGYALFPYTDHVETLVRFERR